MSNDTQKVWFITAANKGLGAATAREALALGNKVVAAARNPESVIQALGESPDLLPVKLDVTDDAQVRAAVAAAMERFGRIDVLAHVAGYGLIGYFEEMSEALIRKQMETNLFGAMKLTREVLPIMRSQRSGLIIGVSSTSGVRAVGGGSVYSASKFALEGWLEGMHVDLAPYGIRCMIIEPGAFRTDFFNTATSFAFSDLEIDDYREQRAALYNLMVSQHGKQPGDPARFAKAVMQAVTSPNPPLRLLAGKAAVSTIDKHLAERRAEYAAWSAVSAACDFE